MPTSGRAAEGSFLSSDGTAIFFRRWETPRPRAVCLLVHGVAEHSGRYSHLAQALNERRFSVWALDHRGHGRSGGRRGDCRSLDEFVADLHRLVELAGREAPGIPRVMVGHSLGGLIALTYAVKHPGELRAVAVSSPALRLAHPTDPVTVFVVTNTAKVLPAFPFNNGVNPRILSHDPEMVEAYRRDPLVHRVLTAQGALALRDAMRDSLSLAARLSIPCLLLQAGADEVCDPAAAAEFAAAAPKNLMTFRRYDGFYHEIFNEVERRRPIEDLCRWLETTLS